MLCGKVPLQLQRRLLLLLFSLLTMETARVVAFSTFPQTWHRSAAGRRDSQSSRLLSADYHGDMGLIMSSSSTHVDPDMVSSVAGSLSVRTLNDDEVSLSQVVLPDNDEETPVIFSCLSHFGDFNAWELTQQYMVALKEGGKLADSPAKVVLVGIGSVDSAKQFAKDLQLDELIESGRLTLLVDAEGAVTSALGCYQGWLTVDPVHRERYPQTDVSPYVKLLGMIFGLGSPGTIGEVLYGYVGDNTGNKGVDGRSWVVDSLLQGSSQGRFPNLTPAAFENTPITSSLRPFELATLRLQTGLHIVTNWGKLVPQGKSPHVGDLLTRMGGTFVLDGKGKCQWSYFDQGILTYADVDEVCQVVQAVAGGDKYIPWTSEQKAALKRERQQALVERVETQQAQERQAESERLETQRQLERQAEMKRQETQRDLERQAEIDRLAEAENEVKEQPVSRATTAAYPAFFAQPIEEVVASTVPPAVSIEEIETEEKVSSEEAVPEAFEDEAVYEQKAMVEDGGEISGKEKPLELLKENNEEEEEALTVAKLDGEAAQESTAVPDGEIKENLEMTIPIVEEQSVSSLLEQKRLWEEAKQAKELFQRALLQASLKYAATARSLPAIENKASEKEVFQRELLKAQLRYAVAASAMAMKSMISRAEEALAETPSVADIEMPAEKPTFHTSTRETGSEEPSFLTELSIVNGASNATAATAEDREELFHRAMLQAQLANLNGASSPNQVPPEDRKELFHRALLQAQMQYKLH